MNVKEQLLSEEQLDFLSEMMNIGAGNAVTALSQMLQCSVDVAIPMVHAIPTTQMPSTLGDPSLPVLCVRMDMLGDVTGDLFFIAPEKYLKTLTHLAEEATLGAVKEEKRRGVSLPIRQFANVQVSNTNLSVLAELGSILAGVYLTAVHDFCKLNIYHSIPMVAIDMIQSLLDESLVMTSRQAQTLIMIENKFIIQKEHIKTFLMMIPSVESVNIFVNSIDQTRMAYREG